MNKITLLFLLFFSLTVSSEDLLVSPENKFCYESSKAKLTDNLVYLFNKSSPYIGENICLYADSGNKYSVGFISNGVLDGDWSFWNNNETIKSKIYYDKGKILKKTEFYYYPNKQEQLWKEVNYKNGLLDGSKKEWSDKGELWHELFYKEGKLQTKTIFTYFEDLTLKTQSSFKKNKLHGQALVFYNNGQIMSVKNYNDGVLEGESSIFYESGQLQFTVNYTGGKKNGFQEEFYENGFIGHRTMFKNNVKNGLETSWYPDGQKLSEKNYVNGKLDGPSLTWLKNGNYNEQKTYKNGLLDGDSIYWDTEINKIWLIRNFEKGVLISKTQYTFFSDGKTKSKLNYKKNKPHGEQIKWFENGEIQTSEFYINGKKEGFWKSWHNNGKKFFSGAFLNDKPEGKVIFWNKNGEKDEERLYKNGILISKIFF